MYIYTFITVEHDINIEIEALFSGVDSFCIYEKVHGASNKCTFFFYINLLSFDVQQMMSEVVPRKLHLISRNLNLVDQKSIIKNSYKGWKEWICEK